MRPRALDHIVLRVANAERAVAWYATRLGLEPERLDDWRRGDAPFPSVRVSAETVIDLVEQERTGENMAHLCLAVEEADLEELARSGRFEVVEEPSVRWGARGSGQALYVRDPDGNVVELRSYR